MWSSLFSFFSGYVGKALVLGCVFLAFFVLKLRLDAAQARLEKSRLEVSALQSVNEKQHAAIQTLLQNQQKQNELITAYEQAKREAENSLAKKKKEPEKFGRYRKHGLEKAGASQNNTPLIDKRII